MIEGNRAWKAAAEVRQRWLAGQLLSRRAAPREVAVFAARQLLAMPAPVSSSLAAAHRHPRFAEITGRAGPGWLDLCDTATAGRVPLAMLAPIAACYELALTEGEGKNTWRPGRHSPCPCEEAGRYFTFLASLGYPLSAIEQAVATGTPCTGGSPAQGIITSGPDAGSGPAAAQPGESGPDESGPAGPGDSAAMNLSPASPADTWQDQGIPAGTGPVTGQAAA